MTKDEQLKKVTEKFLPAFLGFAINKVGNIAEAEELAQEMAFQTVKAVDRGINAENFDAYVWSIAHNTFKRWCGRKKPLSLDEHIDTFSNIISSDVPVIEQVIDSEDANSVRLALSRLARNYRETLVCFYYDEMSVNEISVKLSLSEGMVKFYLHEGKRKLKEVFDMNTIGEKSFNPSEFEIYKSSIDFSKVNVWEVFKRKLPCQIAIVCHDSAKSVSEISLERGIPSVYIEDEIQLLMETGVMITPVKGKYRANFHILKENTVLQVREQFNRLYDSYAPLAISTFEKHFSEIKQCDIFKYEASQNQWAWFYRLMIPDFNNEGNWLSDSDYPQILSCGSKAVIFAQAAKGSIWGMGSSPIDLEKCTVWACDVVAFGEYRRQTELLWNEKKTQALYDIYCG